MTVTIYRRNIKSTGTGICITYSTDCYQRLTFESWFTNLEQTSVDRSQITGTEQTTY